MTERELQSDLRALIKRWEAEAERLGQSEVEGEQGEAAAMELCIADLKELIP